jgi:hypothetical protein
MKKYISCSIFFKPTITYEQFTRGNFVGYHGFQETCNMITRSYILFIYNMLLKFKYKILLHTVHYVLKYQ